MDRPLLKTFPTWPTTWLLALLVFSGALFGCLFDDPLIELDPSSLDDGFFDTLGTAESYRVARTHLLESFGAYACSSCPGAETRLAAFLHGAPGTPAYSPDLIIVNYHVAFPAMLVDPWLTPGTQARHDQLGFTGLPQVTLNGSNAPYGVREKQVRHEAGEYELLIGNRTLVDSLTWLDLNVDTVRYDSVSQLMTIGITVLNRSPQPRGGLSVRVLAVKNRPAVFQGFPWEVIVAETTDRDSSGTLMTLGGMAGLRSRSWTVTLSVPPEAMRSIAPPELENPADYGIVVFARNSSRIVENATARGYNPQP